MEKEDEKEKAAKNPADYFVAGTFNFKIKFYNLNKFFGKDEIMNKLFFEKDYFLKLPFVRFKGLKW